MKRYFLLSTILFLSLLFLSTQSSAFWIWTPETNKWVNPKYSVKETPGEQLQVGLDLMNQKEHNQAIAEFKKLLKYYPLSKEAPEAQFDIGLSLEEQEKLFEAFKAYQVVIDKYPFSERCWEVVKRQYNIGLKMLEGLSNQGKFKEAFLGNDYDVIDIFRAVIKNAPYGELAPVAQYKIGLYLLEKQLYQEARDELEKVVNNYSESEWAKAAQYQIAIADSKRSPEAQYDQKITKVAVDEFKEFAKIYPGAELSEKAKVQISELREKEAHNNFLIAEFYQKQKDYKAAKVYYQSVVEDYAESKWAAKALERLRAIVNKE